MQPKVERSPLRRQLLTGFKAGLFITVFDVFSFFFVPSIREATLSVLTRAMEPLLLVTPLAIAGICLIGYLLTFIFPHRT